MGECQCNSILAFSKVLVICGGFASSVVVVVRDADSIRPHAKWPTRLNIGLIRVASVRGGLGRGRLT